MSNTKNKFFVKQKYFHFVLGIACCLLAIILIINVGVIARALVFPFLSLFGITSYLIYAFIYIQGVLLSFTQKSLHFKNKIRILGLVIIFISILILTTLYALNGQTLVFWESTSNNFFTIYETHSFAQFSDPLSYFNEGWINLFGQINTSSFTCGGGLIGYFLTSLLCLLGTTFAYIVGILLLVFGLIFYFLPEIIRLAKAQAKKAETPVPEESVKITKKKKVNVNQRITNRDVISTAKDLNEEDKQNSLAPSNSLLQSNTYTQTSVSYGAYQTGNGSIFAPVKFHTSLDAMNISLDDKTSHTSIEKPLQEVTPLTPYEQEEEEKEKQVQVLLKANEEDKLVKPEVIITPHHEQLDIFDVEEETNQVDTSLVTTQTVYAEPVVVKEGSITKLKPLKERLKFIPPDISLLNDYATSEEMMNKNTDVALSRQEAINRIFQDFKVGAACTGFTIGPSVTRYNISYERSVTITAVRRVIDDVMRELGGVLGRFEQIVKGEKYSGLEIPNANTITVSLKEVISQLPTEPKHSLAIGFGKDISGKIIQADFNDFPHILVAGTTGSGKSVFIHEVIMTLIMRNSPDDVKLVLIDPKRVEMNLYLDIPHLLCPVINDPDIAKQVLSKLCDEMDSRYTLIQKAKVLSIFDYNNWAEQNNEEKMPYIIIIFDEYADCVDSCKDIGQSVTRIAQKARAAGIYMLIATQRPSVNVITGTIKGNLPTHVALMTSNVVDSQVILGEGGAETLLGHGDMLIQSPLVSRIGSIRCQSPFVQNDEINRVTDYLRSMYPTNYDPEYTNLRVESAVEYLNNASSIKAGSISNNDDEVFEDIKSWAMSQDYVSMSRIQREFSMGFNRAGKLFKRLQEEGIVADKPDTASSAKGCRVLVHDSDHDMSIYDDNDTNDSEGI